MLFSEEEQKPNNKMDTELQKAVKNIESTQCKPEDDKPTPQHNVNQQMALQVSILSRFAVNPC